MEALNSETRSPLQISVLEAPVYQEYHGIHMVTNRISRSKVEVMLGINEEKLEVYPKGRFTYDVHSGRGSEGGGSLKADEVREVV